MSAIGILLCDDLLFTSRISGTARALGLEMRTARNVAALEEIARQQEPACVIVDVHHPGLNLPALVAVVRRGAACTIVAYGSHVAADVLQAARDAGCDVVLPRSKFVDTLADEMPRWYATGSAKPPREVP